LQLTPYVLKKPLEVHVRGGATYGKWAPPIDYLTRVFLPIMARFGYTASFDVQRHGFYPKGGADAVFVLQPWKPKGRMIVTESVKLEKISVLSIASKELQKAYVAERQAKAAKHALNAAGLKVSDEISYADSLNPGSGIVCYAEYERMVLGGDSLGERGVRAEDVGKTAAQRLLAAMNSKGALDSHASDMILPFLALAGGEVRVQEITEHVRTNIATIEKFLQTRLKMEDALVKTSS
ncbi:MAG: RNA 3'-phosphate cyclase, partial [Candidatus Aenigmarchaeota archaeon]|nr:RNA 3'-phosphate cyclase [Candidatus Aenigmarchaeota archaeon]